MTSAIVTELRRNRLLWLLVAVPALFVVERVAADAHTALFVISVLAIVPLATLLSHATESVAARTGDAVGGLLNATLGNLTELVIALTALRAGMLFLASIAMLVPSVIATSDRPGAAKLAEDLSIGLAVLLLVTYLLGLLFSLRTHRDLFVSAAQDEGAGEGVWPVKVAAAVLVVVTVLMALVALVSEVFVESVQQAAVTFGMTPAFVGFIVVAPVLVLASHVIAPAPMSLHFWPGAVAGILIATFAVSFVANSGRSAWFAGVQLLVIYLAFAMTLYLIPPVVD